MLVYTSKGPFTILPIRRTAQVVIKEMQPNGCIDIECWTSNHTGVVVTYDAYKKGKVVQYSRLKRDKKAGQPDFLGIYPTGPKRQENVLKNEERVYPLNYSTIEF